MMRWLILVVVAIVLSTVATVAVQMAPSAMSDTTIRAPVIPKAPDGPAPLAEVDQPMAYNFGTMSQEVIGSHVFKVRNVGKADLSMKVRSTTCKCTVANLGTNGEATVKPGEVTEIRMEWHTREVNGEFDQTATINTNDPLHEKLEFKISGRVQPPILMFPPDTIVQFTNLPNEKGGTIFKTFVSPDRPNFKITSITSSRPDLIEGKVEAIDSVEAAKSQAGGGQRMAILVKPGSGVGPFDEELLLKTNHPSRPELRVMVVGRLLGPINAAPAEVSLPNVLGARGATSLISLFVRDQAETHFTVEKVPGPLKVTVAPVDDHSNAGDAPRKNRQYRVTVTVPRGTPSQEISGTIVLKTDHPAAGELVIPVKVIVTGG